MLFSVANGAPQARASPVQGEVAKMFHFGRRGCSSTTIPQSKIIDFCQLPLHKGAFGRYTAKLINNNLP